MEIYLRYVGQAALPDVPARDLTRAEADAHGVQRLLGSGLYRHASEPPIPACPGGQARAVLAQAEHNPPKQGRGSHANKSLSGGSQNKEE